MKFYLGASAFSAFRIKSIQAKLSRKQLPFDLLAVQYIYFIEKATQLSAKQHQVLCQLLQLDTTHLVANSNRTLFVMPRVGTISPWSSKAADILSHCGLTDLGRIEQGKIYYFSTTANNYDVQLSQLEQLIHDPLTESVYLDPDAINPFTKLDTKNLKLINILSEGIEALKNANQSMGLALNSDEIRFLFNYYQSENRNPTDAEVMMFAQANSEHCRHKLFNANWQQNTKNIPNSLFELIQNTHQCQPNYTKVAYADNAAILSGESIRHWVIDPKSHYYKFEEQQLDWLIKVETHNHPTAISPYAGAATGSGGEIRDEAAAGRGGATKAGLVGFSVANLRIPGYLRDWENSLYVNPGHLSSALDIILQAPIGSAGYNNEFGRPGLLGYFRTLEIAQTQNKIRSFHKPIMIAGGLGSISAKHTHKLPLPVGAKILVLGGPGLLIGLGGGAASSRHSISQNSQLDFASVQRDNPEMQRRCQEVINQCIAMAEQNPILSIHDVGAGGLSNAIPEIVKDAARGAKININAIPCDDPSLSPLEIWSNEAQERYVMAALDDGVKVMQTIAERENCPIAVVGEVIEAQTIVVESESNSNQTVINLPFSTLFPNFRQTKQLPAIDAQQFVPLVWSQTVSELCKQVLKVPAVASKSFLITIADRTITGLVARDQMVGPWQVPVSDCAVTCSGYQTYLGEAMAMGERPNLAIVNPVASARMAVAEALTNLLAADIKDLHTIKLSANWMVASAEPFELQGLREAVVALGKALCPEIGISIPVGKDSVSMQTKWHAKDQQYESVAPLSLIISAFSQVEDVRRTLTPELKLNRGETELVFIDIAKGKQRLGGSAVAQATNQLGIDMPDVEDVNLLRRFIQAIQDLKSQQLVLSYHDRSDGGLWACLCEMAFAAHVGLSINIGNFSKDPIAALLNEELGVVLQIRTTDKQQVSKIFQSHGITNYYYIGKPNSDDVIRINFGQKLIISEPRVTLQKIWAETSYALQSLRDNPRCAESEYQKISDSLDPGLAACTQPKNYSGKSHSNSLVQDAPKVAILREQGTNGHREMAAAFATAGFQAVDVHLNDLQSGKMRLDDFSGLVICGGFSYGDVLGAGMGYAKRILTHYPLTQQFQQFFNRIDTFSLGVCNGCQVLSQLRTIIPGTETWPIFQTNHSEQFEARLSLVEIQPTQSILFKGMSGWRLPVAVAHREGRAEFNRSMDLEQLDQKQLVTLSYIDSRGRKTQQYPANPNGSPFGMTGFTSLDGRVNIMMPHPERVYRTCQMSWYPDTWGDFSPWIKLFENAYQWVRARVKVPNCN